MRIKEIAGRMIPDRIRSMRTNRLKSYRIDRQTKIPVFIIYDKIFQFHACIIV